MTTIAFAAQSMLILLCGLSSLPPAINADTGCIHHLRFTVISKTITGKKTQIAINAWVCNKENFFIEQVLPGDSRICSYYDGNIIHTGTITDSNTWTVPTIYNATRIKDKAHRQFCALFYCSLTLPSLVDPLAKTCIFKHCIDMKNVAGDDEMRIESDDKYRIYISKYITYKYLLTNGRLASMTFKRDGTEIVIVGESDGDVTGYNSDIILRKGREVFGRNLSKEFTPEDKTDDLIKFADNIIKK